MTSTGYSVETACLKMIASDNAKDSCREVERQLEIYYLWWTFKEAILGLLIRPMACAGYCLCRCNVVAAKYLNRSDLEPIINESA